MTRDDTRKAMSIDHIGVDLWQASRAFEEAMFEALVAKGYDDVTTADGDVLVYVGPDGTRSTAIAKSRRITKQAATEQVQRLVRRGYLELRPDPADGRARLVVLTDRGEAMMLDLVSIKRALNARVTRVLGAQDANRLRQVLGQVRDALSS
ncbi:MAG: MarR family winged helix-turn-helix transcriptional regulator [Pseudomonadota bacterium]